MSRISTAGLVVGSLVAACATYQAAPLDPAARPRVYNARSTTDSGLLAFRAATGESPVSSVWSPSDVALAALYFQPSLDEARARLKSAEAAEVTAGARPRPGLGGSLERNLESSAEDSPWGAQLTGTFTIELGGKRGARQAIARAGTVAAEASLKGAAWDLAMTARQSALESAAARGRYDDAGRELGTGDSLLPLLEARYREGAASQADVAQFRTDVQSARLERQQFEIRWRQSEAEVAGQAGMPPERLRAVSLSGESVAGCGPMVDLSRDSLQYLVLGSRWPVAQALAEYQVAEGRLRLEIARQRPDLELGPGLFFDHGITRFLINFALPALPGGNTGPIGEAEAARRTAAAHVAVVQEAVLIEADAALDQCEGLSRELAAADSVEAAARAREQLTRAAYQRGEVTRLEVGFASLAAVRAAVAHNESIRRGRLARARLEAAIGVWPVDGPVRWPDVTLQPVRQEPKEAP
ncbi:MAG TPA: TolC family protein [Gemmatimonadales bacterium]|nr:TolC family protein [Gemmatimonadales bacterium]